MVILALIAIHWSSHCFGWKKRFTKRWYAEAKAFYMALTTCMKIWSVITTEYSAIVGAVSAKLSFGMRTKICFFFVAWGGSYYYIVTIRPWPLPDLLTLTDTLMFLSECCTLNWPKSTCQFNLEVLTMTLMNLILLSCKRISKFSILQHVTQRYIFIAHKLISFESVDRTYYFGVRYAHGEASSDVVEEDQEEEKLSATALRNMSEDISKIQQHFPGKHKLCFSPSNETQMCNI